ncbi:poly(U)-specific endoribonuclease-A-like [Vigna umbellata]|uniref:poly(U)-specific endoribonuclease-A-like n=1 Tax=Vigna umbellata TaxID=87088 RepID=UPI001F5F1E18|nr:poly(U)-specific endoribonuclease-A-like [Vigna umbellata]
MDGLIKDLVDLAIGGADHNDRQEEHGERSWADLVSGDQDQDQPRPHRQQQQQQQQTQWSNSPEKEERWEEDSHSYTNRPHQAVYRPQHEESQSQNFNTGHKVKEDQDEWQTVGKPSRRPQKVIEDQDGWQTVGNPPRRTQKVPKETWQNYKRPSEEQEYSNEVEIGAGLNPSEDELADLSKACDKLWDLDLNRLVPGKDYEIDCGEGKKVFQNEDMAEGSLFTWVSDDVFRRPTFARFLSLLDNYNPNEGCKEVVTSEERQEQASFIEEISRTAPIKYLYNYLASKGIASGSYQDFKRMMTNLWFDLYGRGGTSGSSSSFEHVFVGEIKQSGEVSGFHNWLQFYLEEEKGRVDYQGYIFPRRRGETPDSETQLLTVQFEWNGVLKSLSSTLVGVSPEFEIALYTLCFYVGREDNHIQLGPYPVNIKCYRFGNKIGSVFPIAES